jgi:hypothetical protein
LYVAVDILRPDHEIVVAKGMIFDESHLFVEETAFKVIFNLIFPLFF